MAKTGAAPAKTKPIRRDPAPRPLDGTAPWAWLKDKTRGTLIRDGISPSDGSHNVLVYENSPDARADYESKGYMPRIWGESHVVPAAGKTGKEGVAIVIRGHLLMFLPAEEYQAIIDDGRRLADAKHKKIFGRADRGPRRPADLEPRYHRTVEGDRALTLDFRNDSREEGFLDLPSEYASEEHGAAEQ